MTNLERVRANRAAQGLPERLEDLAVVDRVLAVLTAGPAGRTLTATVRGQGVTDVR